MAIGFSLTVIDNASRILGWANSPEIPNISENQIEATIFDDFLWLNGRPL